MSAWLAAAYVCAAVLAAATWLWSSRLRTSAPGPPTLPLLGNALHFFKQPVLLHRVAELHKRYGDVFRMYLGPKLVVVVTQPEDVKRVMITSKVQDRDPYFTRSVRLVIGNGLLTNSGETWKTHRKFLEPAFHFEVLEKYLDTFIEEGRLLCENLTSTCGTELDVYPVLCLCTMRIVMSAVCGIEFDRVEPDPCKQAQIVAQIIIFMKTATAVAFRPWKSIGGFVWMTPEGRELKRLMEVCRNFTQRYLALLRDTICRIRDKEPTHWMSRHSEEDREKPVIEDVMRVELATLVLAGSETTAGALSYALALLGLHPEWQQQAQRQLDQLFGAGGDFPRPITTADLSQLTVVDAIVKETLRLFPANPVLGRLLAEDVPLAGGRYVAPRGCCVFVAFCLMHRHPSLFPDPDKFDPGRFLPGGSATSRRSGSYMPFSTGTRRCLGELYAVMEMKILLAMMLHRFRVIPGSSRKELEDTLFSITSHPLTGCRVTFVPRGMSYSN